MESRRAANKLGHFRNGFDGWPDWEVARTQVYTVEQEVCGSLMQPGQTIFVPSNWYHEVENLTDCLSVSFVLIQLNHNWCNSVNLISMYDAMEDEVCQVLIQTDDVIAALDDVREMLLAANPHGWREEFARLVQDIVRQDAGWAWDGFWHMVLYNIEHQPCDVRLVALKQPIYRPSDEFVHDRVRSLLERFAKRSEAAYLPAAVHAQLCKLQVAVNFKPT